MNRQASVPPGSWQAWVLASRPPTLFAAVAPVVVAVACVYAVAEVRWLPSWVALISALWIQIGTNFANDVFDFEAGADTEERLGPLRAVQAGLLSPEQMRRGMWLAFGLALLGGVYLTWVGGWPLLVIGIVSIVSGIAYTGGPYPLGYHGLGDVFVLVFFGFVAVCGTVFLNLGTVPAAAWWVAVPPGALATAILVVNNVRDRQTDVVAGKRTLAVRLGRRAGIAEYIVLLLASFAIPFVLWSRLGFALWIFLPWLCVPLAWGLTMRLIRNEGQELNPVLAGTARLMMIFAALLALGLVLGGPPSAA